MSDIRAAVSKLYNTYPFPPEALLDEPPPGHNWRWSWLAAYNFCRGEKPPHLDIRILDAGCGTGVGTEYLIMLNPQAEVVAIDISEEALSIAQERCHRSGVIANSQGKVAFHQLPLEEAETLPGQFDLINCVGVLHHLANPIKGIQSLAKKLRPGGLMHIFVYSELGRWEISLMQQAISLLQGEKQGDYVDGVDIGRKLFATLPPENRLVKRDKERWSLENHLDGYFADMYVHPQEIDYNVNTLFELIDASGLEFVGFSNPKYWQIERLLGNSSSLMERAAGLTPQETYRLIELLDPDIITHYEFFLSTSAIEKNDWANDNELLAATSERHPCINGWPSQNLFNLEYEIVNISEAEFQFLSTSDGEKTVKEILATVSLDLNQVRALLTKQLIILKPQISK